MTGLSANILKTEAYGDCTNNGFSSDKNSAFVFSATSEFGGNYEIDDMEGDYLVIMTNRRNEIKAIPKSIIDEGRWPMFGGNFIYSSDSRFAKLNNGNPIKIFDRVE